MILADMKIHSKMCRFKSRYFHFKLVTTGGIGNVIFKRTSHFVTALPEVKSSKIRTKQLKMSNTVKTNGSPNLASQIPLYSLLDINILYMLMANE